MSRKKQNDAVRGEVLVALLKDVSDFAILRDQGWYRIPEASAPKNWPPKWLAFYQPKSFAPVKTAGEESQYFRLAACRFAWASDENVGIKALRFNPRRICPLRKTPDENR
jgi:hypothetical protein